MPRPLRTHVAHGIYFVILRGSVGQPLVSEEDDRIDLERLIATACEPCSVRIHAYCWLERELHLVVQVADIPLSRFIQRVASPYAHRKQQRARVTGHLFAQRYDATLIERAPLQSPPATVLAHWVRHIHRAPIREGRVTNAAAYRWSSHRAYLGLTHVPWLTTTVLLAFGRNRVAAREAFDEFVNGNGTRDTRFEALRKESASTAARTKPQDYSLPFESIDELISAVCRTQGITREQLHSRRPHPGASLARSLIAWRATRTGLAALKQVAGVLGRHPSTLSVAMDRHRAAHPHLFRHPMKPR